jgi:nitrogenase subunit NifH
VYDAAGANVAGGVAVPLPQAIDQFMLKLFVVAYVLPSTIWSANAVAEPLPTI